MLPVDKWWVRAGVIGTFICAGLQGWAVYRIEFPSTASPQQLDEKQNAAPPPSRTADEVVTVNHAPPLWLLLVPTVLSASMLLAAVLIAFRHPESKGSNASGSMSKLKIHSAYYGTEATNYEQVPEERILRENAGGVVEYSYGDNTRKNVRVFERQLLVLPEDPAYEQKIAGLNGSVAACQKQVAEKDQYIDQLRGRAAKAEVDLRNLSSEYNVLLADHREDKGELTKLKEQFANHVGKAVNDLVLAGKLKLLIDTSLSLEGQLRGILESNHGADDWIDLSHPLTISLTSLTGNEARLPWQKLRLSGIST
jgi:hypothetical protein